jgi:diketogulonate reductase-like aldo/keto reductase
MALFSAGLVSLGRVGSVLALNEFNVGRTANRTPRTDGWRRSPPIEWRGAVSHHSETPMPDEVLVIDGMRVPRFLYGTAWKEDRTQALTELALRQGFRGIDTANQRRHYHEAAVGQAITASVRAGVVSRSDLFLQTKFTFRSSQDHRLPYDPDAPIPVQVEQSFASSLEQLGTDTIDSYVLHGPSRRSGLAEADWLAWHAMEALHARGRARFLGVSNVTLEQLQRLCHGARVPPRFVQNRCYAARGWDHQVREFCAAHAVVYQGFSLLTANRDVMAHSELVRIAKRHGRSVAQVVFRFALEVGMMPLTGTTDAGHMRADLDVFGFRLELDEIEQIDRLGER